MFRKLSAILPAKVAMVFLPALIGLLGYSAVQVKMAADRSDELMLDMSEPPVGANRRQSQSEAKMVLSDIHGRYTKRFNTAMELSQSASSRQATEQQVTQWTMQIASLRAESRGDMGTIRRYLTGRDELVGNTARSLQELLSAEDTVLDLLGQFIERLHAGAGVQELDELHQREVATMLDLAEKASSFGAAVLADDDEAKRLQTEQTRAGERIRAEMAIVTRSFWVHIVLSVFAALGTIILTIVIVARTFPKRKRTKIIVP